MGRQRGHAHRHDCALSGRERPNGRQELVGSTAIHDAQDGPSPLGQAEGSLPPVLGLLLTLDQTPPDKAVDQAAGGRWRPADLIGEFADRHRAAIREDIQGGELGEPQTQLPELTGEPDDELAPEGSSHRDPLAQLADVLDPAAGREHGG